MCLKNTSLVFCVRFISCSLRVFRGCLMVCVLSFLVQASANEESDRVDISDIEKKYWAPKDTDFSVVQNRTYEKDKRVAFSAQYGPMINDSYSKGYNLGLSANYFFSERYGLQLSYVQSDLADNETTRTLSYELQAGGARPNHGKTSHYYGVGFNWVPFYAKMSLLGKRILYFDMSITPTIGMTSYDQEIITGNRSQSSFTYGIDVTQYFFLSRHVAIRGDLINRWFNEEVVQYRQGSGARPTGSKVEDKVTHTTMFLIGLTFFY